MTSSNQETSAFNVFFLLKFVNNELTFIERRYFAFLNFKQKEIEQKFDFLVIGVLIFPR